jgi:hypothetical protein
MDLRKKLYRNSYMTLASLSSLLVHIGEVDHWERYPQDSRQNHGGVRKSIESSMILANGGLCSERDAGNG